ncbi:MAG: tRNA (adenosine(37)-N6)-threonylcarbamoyltransferase complex ATPase subunit type 1 TsaE [Saprospiraceae bacterium]
MIKIINTLNELPEIADILLSKIKEGYLVILFHGELGAGKTTLVQLLCKSLGVDELVSSPTFSIIQEYSSTVMGTIIHMDLYRIEKPQELEQIGFAEYLDSGQLCLIEWPEAGSDYFVMPHIRIDIGMENNIIRNFKITTHDTVDA